ncbi:MAG: flagellin [Solirubrobacteraceae bacterium]
MGLTINTNLEAMNASRNLNNTENMLATSMQRLSSGLKINSAADDVAGYAISESLQSQVNGLNQASENIQDAVALAQTAQGALNDVNQMLQRIRELAVQYSNGTTSTEDQTAIISEVSQLVEEIKRVGETTQFNGKSLLDGDEEISFQVGANDGEHVGVTTIELYKSIEAKLEITTLGERLEGSEEVSKEVKEAKETALTTAETALTTPANELTSAEGAVTTAEGEISTAKATYESEIENDELNKSEDKAEAEVTQASEKTAIEGKEATLVTLKATATEKEEAVTPLKKTVTEAEAKVTKEEKEITTLKAAIKAADEPAKTATGLKELSEAIAKVAGLAGEFGAVQDRIQYTQSNLEVYSQNLTSAVSALDDVNMATEMTNFTKDQVLQQAGVSILAQANQLPDATLKLLE